MSYAPPGESADDLWLERSYFVGGFLAAVAYGIHCCISGTTIYFLLHRREVGRGPSSYKLISFVLIIWAISTINLATGIQWNMMIFINDRNFPGGPPEFLHAEYSLWLNTLSNTCYVIDNCLTDLMVLYRAFIIWGCNYRIILIPFLAVVTSTVLSVLTLVQSALPGASLWAPITFSFAVPYWSLSIAINILLTLMIVLRLLLARRQLRSVLDKDYGRTYTSLIAIIIESGAIYAVVSLTYIVAFARNSNVQNLVLPSMCQVMCIAPDLIILRVAFGKAFTTETAASLSGLRFQSNLPVVKVSTGLSSNATTAAGPIPPIAAVRLGPLKMNKGMGPQIAAESDGVITPEGSRYDIHKKEDP